MKTGPVGREIAAWGWYVDRLCDLALAFVRGAITEQEKEDLRTYYLELWKRHEA